MTSDWREAICSFWFSFGQDQWFGNAASFDQLVKQQFHNLWKEKRQLPAEAFLDEPLSALAAALLFDQMPRNMFRGNAEQFATDHLALAVSKIALKKGLDDQLTMDQRAFLYLPFEHSESLVDQNRSVLLFTALGDARYLKFAKLHRDIVERFGRFPHRNSILGRPSTIEEIAAGEPTPW